MKVSGRMRLIIILKVTKNRVSPSLHIFQKTTGEGGRQIDHPQPSAVLGLTIYLVLQLS